MHVTIAVLTVSDTPMISSTIENELLVSDEGNGTIIGMAFVLIFTVQ